MEQKLIDLYRANRKRFSLQDHPAKSSLYWAKRELNDDRVMYFTRAYDDRVALPGGLTLVMTLETDDMASPFEQVKTDWRHYYGRTDCGKYLGNGWYSTGFFDRGRDLLCINFGRDGSYKTRFDYLRSRGVGKQDADVRVRQAINSECNYWRRVAEGAVSYVGVVVKLLGPDDEVLGEDSIWGCDYDDRNVGDWHGLEYANDMARGLLAEHARKLDEVEMFYAGM